MHIKKKNADDGCVFQGGSIPRGFWHSLKCETQSPSTRPHLGLMLVAPGRIPITCCQVSSCLHALIEDDCETVIVTWPMTT